MAVAIPLVVLTRREREAQRDELERLEALTRQLAPLAAKHPGARRLFLNGAPVVFGVGTSPADTEGALDAVRADCESGDRVRMLGLPPERDEHTRGDPPPRLRKVERVNAGPELGAVLCIFDAPGGEGTMVRYSRAQRSEGAKVTSVFTVSTESASPLDALFPTEGDAPGGDLPNVPRPEGSRRDFAASFEGETYGVRIYEAKGEMNDVVRKYDETMTKAGYASSAGVASAFLDARSYRRDGAQVVASFEQREGATIVSIAQLDPLSLPADAGVD